MEVLCVCDAHTVGLHCSGRQHTYFLDEQRPNLCLWRRCMYAPVCVCVCCVHLIHKSMKDVQPHFPQSTYRRTLHEKFKDFRQISKSIIYKYKERTFENTRTHRDTPTNHSYTVDGGHVLGNVYPTQNLSEQHTHTHSLHGWWRRVETEDRQATEEWRDQFPCHVETASTCSFHSPGKCVHFNLKQRTFHRSC